MPHQPRQDLLRSMVRQLAPDSEAPNLSYSLESTLSENDQPVVQSALEKVATGKPLVPEEEYALEAIVLPKTRPVVNVVNGSFGKLPAPWEHLSKRAAKNIIERVIPSIGRVDIPSHEQIPYAGTGFVVGEGLLMTNRHVAELFATGTGLRELRFRPGYDVAVDFLQEYSEDTNKKESELLTVEGVKMIHPYWDMALLQVSGLSVDRALSLAVDHPDDLGSDQVVVIGYPARDWRNDSKVQDDIFKGVYNVKRLQPGELRPRQVTESFGNDVNALTHDASTLGGNSGSAVISIATGQVVGLHFAGRYLEANYAVPAYELARDSRVVDSGVIFDAPLPPATNEWESQWPDGSEISPVPPTPEVGGLQVPSGEFSWTIPLKISVSLGSPTPVAAQPCVTVQSVSRPVATTSEGQFRGRNVPPAAFEFAHLEFPIESLGDDLAIRKRGLAMALCSKLAYGLPSLIETTVTDDWSLKFVHFIEEGGTQLFVAGNDDDAIVCFRGTDAARDWLINLRVLSQKRSYGKVHRGFAIAFDDVQQRIVEILGHELKSHKRLHLAGHSLGGAQAVVAAAELGKKFKVASLNTFGQPAVGKSTFNKHLNTVVGGRYFRFVNNNDIVTRVPPSYRHYQDKGHLFHFDSAGKLRKTESMGVDIMSEPEFEFFQESLQQSKTEGVNQEGLPSFSDHDMSKYVKKIDECIKSR